MICVDQKFKDCLTLCCQDTSGLDIVFMSPVEAMQETCTRARKGLDTISVTGNVLRYCLVNIFVRFEEKNVFAIIICCFIFCPFAFL